MRITFPETLVSKFSQAKAQSLSLITFMQRPALFAIVLLAAALRFSDLSKLGYINHYYTAAIVSMLKSWHNFFFVAAEPGGAVSVDKPPLGLWIQAISARIFGVNTFGLILPEVLAGLLSVIMVYYLVKRSFGLAAGLLAGLALAITPVVVATDRNNTMDSLLILTLLLAAWAFIKATETARLRYLLAGTSLVGLGFNIKMLEAYLPLPAFFALYFLGARERIWPKLGKLVLAALLLLVVSFSWVAIVDLTPASQRPYVGSSGDNSEMSLIFGYNGLERLFGMGRTSFTTTNSFGNAGSFFNGGQPPSGFGSRPNGGVPSNQQGGRTFGGQGFRGSTFTGGAAAGGNDTGQAGLFRLVTAPLSKEASWLLPVALFGMVLLVFREKRHWPLAPQHQALVLWGIWLLTDVAFFSIAGFFHQYYLAQLAPPLVALAAIAIIELWHLRESHAWLAVVLLLAVAGITLKFELDTAATFMGTPWWQSVAIGLFVVGGAVLILTTASRLPRLAFVGVSILMAAILVTPGIWSALTTANPTSNQSLPAAYSGQTSAPANNGSLEINQALLSYLQANTQGMKYLMAVPSSMQGSDYVITTGRPVLYLGGFMGIDQVVDSTQLASLVSDHELRFIYWDSRGNGFGGSLTNEADLSSWINASCKAVNGYQTTTQNSGAPGGTTSNSTGNNFQNFGGFGQMQITLYDCGG